MKQVLIRRGSPVVADVPSPQLADDILLVEVHCCLISTGTEVAGLAASPKSIVQEAINDPSKVTRGLRMIRETGLQRTMALVNGEIGGAVPTGYSCAGKVIAVGNNISGFCIGDRVACAGAGKANHAEIVAVPQNLVVQIPDDCDMESASSATVGAIAVQGLRRADARLGEFVAVVGLGLIGQLTLQLLQVSGCRTIGVEPDGNRIDVAKRMGLTNAVNPSETDPVRAVLELTSGIGADAVIITASSADRALIQQAMQMVRRKGRVVVVGAVPLEMERSPFYEKEADLLISCSYGPGRYDPVYEERGIDYPYAYVRWTENRNLAEYLRLIATRQINFKGIVEKTWTFDRAPEAYEDLKQNRRLAVLLLGTQESNPKKLASRIDINPSLRRTSGQIRVGIIGPGGFVKAVHLPNLKQLSSQYEISAIVARTGSAAWNIAHQYGARYASTNVDDLLRDPEIDLVMIASRHNTHARYAIEAANAGKAVFLEKPAALSESELDSLMDTLRTTCVPFMVGFNRRFSPFLRQIKSFLDQRANSAVLTYRMNAGTIPLDSWIQGFEGGGRIIGEACHIFDVFNYLIGDTPVDVVALPIRSAAPHIAATDNFTSILRYSDGSLCTLTYTSQGSTELPKETMEVFFDGKSLVMDDYRKLSFFGISAKTISKSQQDKGHLEELRQFAEHIHGKTAAPMTLDEIEAASRTALIVDDIVRHGSVD